MTREAHLSISNLRSGDPRALARSISIVENHASGWTELLKELFPHTGRALTIGITGSPGAGKSTLVDQLAKLYRKTKNPHSMTSGHRKTQSAPSRAAAREHHHSVSQNTPDNAVPDVGISEDDHYKIGIIAVDPTSPYTGGAILGDRIRMQDHFSDPGIYIRSMATRGSLGGLARATADVATVLDASGRDVVIIETVGVGQDEIDIVRVADITIVILVPGMGDDVQTIKAGIMEIADIFVINKSDHEGAERVQREIRALQSLAPRKDQWTPPIVKTVASEGRGVKELAKAIHEYELFLRKENLLQQRRSRNWEIRLVEMLRDAMLEKARAAVSAGDLSRLAAEIAEHKRDPYSVVEHLAAKMK